MFEEELALWMIERCRPKEEGREGAVGSRISNGHTDEGVDRANSVIVHTNSAPLRPLRSTSFPEIVHEVIELAARDAALHVYQSVRHDSSASHRTTPAIPSGSALGAQKPRGLVLICGTAYFMPQVRAALGIQEPR
jgi:hypothetical protein